MVDKRTLEKYEREAKEKNRETWYETYTKIIVCFLLCAVMKTNCFLISVPVELYYCWNQFGLWGEESLVFLHYFFNQVYMKQCDS